MFEKRLKKISDNLRGNEKEYFILTHKKHKREIYFQNTEEAIEFIKIKFDSPFKGMIYSLLKFKLLQKFLKKIRLSSKFGEVIFVANQIKGFDLKNKVVSSFMKDDSEKDLFIKTKEFQKKVSERGFASKIFELNKNFPFSKEELLPEYNGKDDYNLFKRLYSFYEYKGIEKIPAGKYIGFLIKKLEKKKIEDLFIKKTLEKIRHINRDLLITTIHGAFTKEQALLKKDSYVFIDWEAEKNLIIRDLVTFFGEEDNLLGNRHLLKLLEIYPREIKENIKLYLILNEIYHMAKKGVVIEKSKEKIRSIFRGVYF